jgi:hypothetical protein
MASDSESDEEVVFPSDSEEETEADGIGAVADECSSVTPTSGPPSMTRQLSYTMVMGTEEVLRMRAQMINDVMEVGLDEEAATDLLVKSKWNLADTMEGVLNATSSSLPLPLVAETSGIKQQSGVDRSGLSTAPSDPPTDRCLVCDEPPPLVDLGCGHGMCSECWSAYLSTALSNRGEVKITHLLKNIYQFTGCCLHCLWRHLSLSVRHPSECFMLGFLTRIHFISSYALKQAVVSTSCFYTDGKKPCPRRVPVSLFQQHLPPDRFALFQTRLAADFIAGHALLSSCPAPNCDLVVR